ncbi:DUF2520 domain-containing protein [soil metagenome]
MKVVFIGCGNVATVLAEKISGAGHEIVQVLSRNENRAKQLATKYNAGYGSFRSTPYAMADIYIVAISDNALSHLDQYPSLGKKIVVHTAGSVSKDVLKALSSSYGIIYPFQSLSKNSISLPSIPIMIDGNTEEVISFLKSFTETFADNIIVADDDQRLKYHIAAVMVSNFTNHLYALAEEFCSNENIEFKNLLPLISETTLRMKDQSPKELQTGPALREDIYTMGKHLQCLTPYPDIKFLYLKISESILKFHQNEKDS